MCKLLKINGLAQYLWIFNVIVGDVIAPVVTLFAKYWTFCRKCFVVVVLHGWHIFNSKHDGNEYYY